MKKMILGFVAVVVIGTFFAVALGSEESSEAEKGPVSQKPSESAKPAREGVVGNWEIQGKVKPKNDGLGDFTATFRVKNISDTEDTPLLTVNALKGNEILASMDCTGPEIGPGMIGTVDCISTDPFRRGWSEVTVENSF